jgi:uncharacterized protein
LTGLAQARDGLRVRRLAPATLGKLHDQAELQLIRYRTGELTYRMLPPEPRRGLGGLPAPSAGDLFFDMEGDPFFDPAASLEFLFGVLWHNADGTSTYLPIWAHDRDGERLAFEQFIDLVKERKKRFPDMHVYHYAAYEATTLSRLMGTHTTRDDEVDDLLRNEVLVDLYQVARQAVRAGVESYSLKEIEKLFFERNAEIGSGNEAMIEFERWLEDGDTRRLDAIANYNREDCLATLALRNWLEERRPEAESVFRVAILPRSPKEPSEGSSDDAPSDVARLRDALLASAVDGDGRALCADLLDYHRREDRPAYWWYYRRREMTDDDLVDDREALGCLKHDGTPPVDLSIANPRMRSLEWAFSFPAQQHHFHEDDVGEDPSGQGTDWKVSEVNNANGVIRLRRARQKRDEPLPTALVPQGPINTKVQQAALRRLAASIVADDRRYFHLEKLLRRELLSAEIACSAAYSASKEPSSTGSRIRTWWSKDRRAPARRTAAHGWSRTYSPRGRRWGSQRKATRSSTTCSPR